MNTKTRPVYLFKLLPLFVPLVSKIGISAWSRIFIDLYFTYNLIIKHVDVKVQLDEKINLSVMQ